MVPEAWDRLRLGSCRACGVEVLVQPWWRDHWLEHYPKILEHRNADCYLTLTTHAPDTQEDLVAKAYDTYAAFLKSIGATTTVRAPWELPPVDSAYSDDDKEDDTVFN
jgi:hypothetical protein